LRFNCQNARMTSDESLILYTRAGCHLCEVAAAMLEAAGLEWRPADIDSSSELMRAYGTRVPVLRRSDTGEELDFPFDPSDLVRFVAQ
jgi:glutaredoxin